MKVDKNVRYGFMSGCSLSSYNSEAVAKTVQYLGSVFPQFAAILKCCGKPTRDLGEMELFHENFNGFLQDIEELHIDEMIFACPNCKATFDKESQFKSYLLWEVLATIGIPEELKGKGKESDIVFTIHDSCSARYDTAAQDGIRWLLDELGYQYVESECAKENTKCCGYGGMVNTVNPELTRKVMQRRVETLEQLPVVTYCATCRSALSQAEVKSWHILDLLWGPVVYSGSEAREDVLSIPDKVWSNRQKTRKALQEEVGMSQI